jgi:hypothetical protein
MNILPLKKNIPFQTSRGYTGHFVFSLLLLLWIIGPRSLQYFDDSVGVIDQSIWLLIILSVICFLGLACLCWWLLKYFWLALGLPSFNGLISHFESLKLWQQLGFYWASYALLLLAAIGCIVGIC